MKKNSLRLLGIVTVLAMLSTTMAGAVPFQLGDVFAGVGSGKINHYNSTGYLLEVLNTTSGSAEQTGMCFDAGGNLYATSWTAGTMSKFNNTGSLLVYPWGGPFSTHPETCVVDAAGNIYVGEVDGANNLRKFNASGGLLANWTPAIESRGIDWIDLAADQKTVFYTSEGSKVKRFDVSNSTQLADFATGLTAACYALRIRANGEVMVACSSQVYRINATGSPIQTYTTMSVGEPSFFFAMNLDPDGKSFWTGGYSTGNIYRINISDGMLLTNFTAPPQVFSMAGLAIFGEPTVAKPPPKVEGNMTGGGSIFSSSMRVTHGFELKCNASKVPNNLQINWGKGNKFHLEDLTTASCTDDPAIMPKPPMAGFDTYEGNGTGRYNGMPGATAHWIFTDAGEPGTSDTALIHVWDSSGVLVLSVSGNLQNGNHQAHEEG